MNKQKNISKFKPVNQKTVKAKTNFLPSWHSISEKFNNTDKTLGTKIFWERADLHC